VSIEEPYWIALKQIAAEEQQSITALLEAIDSGRGHSNLSSAVRVFVLMHYTAACAAPLNSAAVAGSLR
jgi:predicted DNA-binding ribbon-helix-helix protein